MVGKENIIRMAALDLDGTTLRPDGTLSDFSRQVLLRAHEEGIHIVVASGRSFSALPAEVLELPCVEYAIASNGAGVYEVNSGRRILSHYLRKEAVEEILKVAAEAGVMVEGFVDGVPYSQKEYVENPIAFGASPASVDYVRRTRRPVADIFDFLKKHEMCLDSIDLIVGDAETKTELREKLLARVGHIYLTTSVATLLEMADEKAGKANAVKFLTDRLGLHRQQVAAFGNAENDMDMMLWAGTGVAVANAPELVRSSADEVTESNEKDGVARWLLRYMGEK